MNSIGISEESLRALTDERVAELESRLLEKDRILSSYKREHGVLELFFQEIRDNIQKIEPLKMEYKPIEKTRVESPCAAVMHITDSHMGAVQIPSEIEGFGEYNPEICIKRQIDFAEKILDWTETNRFAYTIPEIDILVTGDLISGDIHDELKITNAFSSPVQIVKAAEVLSEQISIVAPHFETVNVHFITEDNHSRLTKKPQAKEAGYNSYNYLVGYIAKERTALIENVIFNIYPQYEVVVNVLGRRYLLCHGHNTMGWMGIPFYGLERKVAKEATRRMNAPDSTKFHKIIAGHFHTPMCFPYFWLGGSVSGTDAYDHKNGRHSEPSQAAWLVHPKHGEFSRTDFTL
jgi:hypothetical protein